MKKRHSEEQIILILRKPVCRQHNVSEPTIYRRRDGYGDIDPLSADDGWQVSRPDRRIERRSRFEAVGGEQIRLSGHNPWITGSKRIAPSITAEYQRTGVPDSACKPPGD